MEHNFEPAPTQRARTDYLTATLVVAGIAAFLADTMSLAYLVSGNPLKQHASVVT